MTQGTLSTTVRRIDDGVAVLDIQGEITSASEDALGEAYAEAAEGGTRAVALNFTGLEYMNSGGIGLLVTLLVRANRAKQKLLAYGLTEHYRVLIKRARLVACPGCYPTAALPALLPIAWPGMIDVSDIIIDAKSGVSGAGRTLKQNILFSEAGEGLSPYGIGNHRHLP